MATNLKLTLKSRSELSLMLIGSGNWAAKDAHLPIGKGSGSKSTWIGRAQVDFDTPLWPASGRIVKATLSGKTAANGAHGEFRGDNPSVSVRRLDARYSRNTDTTADGYYTQNSSVVYPGTDSSATGVSFSPSDTANRTWTKDITDLAGVWAPARITRRNGKAGGGEGWHGVKLLSTDEGSANKSSILSPDMTITIEIDVSATPDQPGIHSIDGAQEGTDTPYTVVGSPDGRSITVEFAFRSPDAADTLARAELAVHAVGATDSSPGNALATTGSVVPAPGSSAGLYRLTLGGLARRTEYRFRVQTTSNNGKASAWTSLDDDTVHVKTATIPGPPLNQVFESYTDDPHTLSTLNSPDPDDHITGWHGRYTRVAAGTSAWDEVSGANKEIGGTNRNVDIPWGGGALADGEVISYIEHHRNRDGVWGTWSAPRTQTMAARVGPSLTPASSRVATRTPTFTIAASSFDGYRLRLLDPDNGRVLYDTQPSSMSAATTKAVTIPAGYLAFGQRFVAVASVRPAGTAAYGAESTEQEYLVTTLPQTATAIVDAVDRRVRTRDIRIRRTITDADGTLPVAAETEIREAATPQGAGALIERRYDSSRIPEVNRLGRQLSAMTSTAGWVASADVTVTTTATAPSGYSGNSLDIQATGGSSTARGAHLTVDVHELDEFGSGSVIRLWRRITSVTNLLDVRLRLWSGAAYRDYKIVAAGATTDTWAEVTVALVDAMATDGTFDWLNITILEILIVPNAAAYTGNVQVRDLRIGTVQTAKATPDGYIAWEDAIDVRARARDDASALLAPTTLSAQATAGDTTVTLTSATGIEVGMSLLIGGAIPEVREVASLGPVTLSDALDHTHANGSAVTVYPWGPWSGWQTVTAMQPPTVALASPADKALLTDPTPALVHTYSSIRDQAIALIRLSRWLGYSWRAIAMGAASYWRLSEASGTFADSVGSVTGTLSGSASRNVTGALAPGDTDGAVDLDGSTGYISLGDNLDLSGTAAFTVGGWVYADTLVNFGTIIAKSDSSDGWWLWAEDDGSVGLTRRASSNAVSCASAAGVVAAGTWHHVMGTYDGAALNVYVDGDLVAGPIADTGSITNESTPLRIGACDVGGSTAWFWDGKLDELGAWTRALSASEVNALAVARTEAPRYEGLWGATYTDDELSHTLPPFLLDDATTYAWDMVLTDSAGIASTAAYRTFATSFQVPAAVASFTATADPARSAVLLAWSDLDPDTWAEVEWQDETGAWIRIDGGPEVLGDTGEPYTGSSLLHLGARLGENAYRMAVSNGWRPSDPRTADATLAESVYEGLSQIVTETGEVIEFPAERRIREPRFVSELHAPPGASPTLIKWGRSGGERRLTSVLWDGEWSKRRRLVALAGQSTGLWYKDRTGDPAWVQITSVEENLADGDVHESVDITLQEVGAPIHAIDPDA